MNYYISDWHYGHRNCLSFDNRPFTAVEDMNAALVERWNSDVRPEDTVYVLGDMFWCKPNEAVPVLKSLRGTKILVKGNHDRVNNEEFRAQFADVRDYMEIDDNRRKLVLCHYPIPCFRNHFHGWYHLYGHVHSSFEYQMMEHDRFVMWELHRRKCAMYNVGVMMPWMDYTPRTLDQILTGNAAFDALMSKEVDKAADDGEILSADDLAAK